MERLESNHCIDQILDYINTHLNEPFTADQLANMAGYSFHHFCHLFRNYTGVPVMTYVRKQRLEQAAEDILAGKPTTQIAAEQGYDTPSGFSKAFRKNYGLSPTEYKALLEVNHAGFPPQIRTISAFSAIGYLLPPPKGEYDILDFGAYWRAQDFSSVSAEDYSKIMTPNLGEIGAWLSPDHDSGDFGYFFGPIVTSKRFVPEGMTVIDIPTCQYAIFGIKKSLTADELKWNVCLSWREIFVDWLNDSPYQLLESGTCFEHYQGDAVQIFLPITLKKD